MAFIRSLARHAQEDELAHFGSRNKLQRLVRGIENLKNLTIVDARIHEASSDVYEEAETSETRATL